MAHSTFSRTLALTTTLVVPATATMHAFLTRPETEEGTRFVNAARLPLRPAPSLDSVPVRADLFSGAAVHVTEEKEGWSRVMLWGWVPSDQLVVEHPQVPSPESPAAPPGEAAAPGAEVKRAPMVIADVDQYGQRITDLGKATRLTVSTVTDASDKDRPAIAVAIGFLNPRSVLVSFEEPPIDIELSLYEKRLIAGSRTHGNRLFTGKVTLNRWEDGLTAARKITIPLAEIDLASARTDTGILVARATLPNGHVVWGRDYDVVLRHSQDRPVDAKAKEVLPQPKPEAEKKDG